MNIWSKSFIFTALLAGIAIQGAEADLKGNAAQRKIDYELFDAVTDGATDKVQTLLAKGANPNCCIYQPTPLSNAIALCHVNIVELLLCQGADANQGLCDNPLTTAIRCIDSCILNEKMDCAELYVHIIKLLLDHGADPNQRNPIVQYNAFCKCIGNYRSHNGNIPYLKTLKLLLEYGADDTIPYNGKTIHDDAETNPELQKILTEHASYKANIKEKTIDICKFPTGVARLCVSYLYLPEQEYRQQRRERIAEAIPQLTYAQDFREHETDLTARIAEYV